MHAILRQKTLLGETYVQLIPEGTPRRRPFLPDGGKLARQPGRTVGDARRHPVRRSNPKTRKDFQVWQESVAEGINGRGEEINADFAELEPFVEHANKLVGILASQEGAVTAVVQEHGRSVRWACRAQPPARRVDRQR